MMPRGKCGKKMFRSELDAKIVLGLRGRRGNRQEQRVYKCTICWGEVWHTTSQKKRDTDRIPQSIDAESSRAIA